MSMVNKYNINEEVIYLKNKIIEIINNDEDVIKQRWSIGLALSMTEIRCTDKKIYDEILFRLVTKLNMRDFKLNHLILYYNFYNTHFNLFNKNFEYSEKLLDWQSYVILMEINNEEIRKQMELLAYENKWNHQYLSCNVKKYLN